MNIKRGKSIVSFEQMLGALGLTIGCEGARCMDDGDDCEMFVDTYRFILERLWDTGELPKPADIRDYQRERADRDDREDS